MVEAGYIRSGANTAFEGYDAPLKSIWVKKNRSNVMQSTFAGGAFGAANCRWFSFVPVQAMAVRTGLHKPFHFTV